MLISSCEQNGRNLVPVLHAPQTLSEFLPTVSSDLKLVLHHRANQALNSYATPQSVCLLIGPEGGLSEEEIHYAEQQGFNPLVLGPRILRTETAPLVALSLVQYQWGFGVILEKRWAVMPNIAHTQNQKIFGGEIFNPIQTHILRNYKVGFRCLLPNLT